MPTLTMGFGVSGSREHDGEEMITSSFRGEGLLWQSDPQNQQQDSSSRSFAENAPDRCSRPRKAERDSVIAAVVMIALPSAQLPPAASDPD